MILRGVSFPHGKCLSDQPANPTPATPALRGPKAAPTELNNFNRNSSESRDLSKMQQSYWGVLAYLFFETNRNTKTSAFP